MAETKVASDTTEEVKPPSDSETPVAEETTNGASVNVEESQESIQDVTPETLKKVLRQLEYYFGDYNLPRDRFLRSQAELDEGWVPLDVMLKFVRLLSITKNPDVIVKAIEDLGTDLLELSEDKKKVRRVPSKPWVVFDEAMQLETMNRTVYCKGFAEDEVLDNLIDFFSKFGKTQTVLMRTYREKNPSKLKFKGSVFAVFSSPEEAESFMKLESVKYKEADLIRKWQKDYNEEKRLERLEKFSKGKKNKSGEKDKEDGNDESTAEEIQFPTKCFIHLTKISGDITREDLKAALQEKCGVTAAFVDFNKGELQAYVRLQGQDSALQAMEKLGESKKLEVNGIELPMVALTEEEEGPHIEKAKQFMSNRKNNKRGGFGGRRGGKRRGGFRGRHDRSAKRARGGDD